MANKVMLTIHASENAPTVAEIIHRYALKPGDIDEEFGVVVIDPEAQDYTILVEPEVAQKIQPNENWGISGPFSNPKIEPLWPPK
jgi:hypothetical protein